MRILGLDITRAPRAEKGAVSPTNLSAFLTGWLPLSESRAGDWQKSVRVSKETAISFHAVFTCVTRIAADIAKIGLDLREKTSDGVSRETSSPAFSPVLRKPNPYQNILEFVEQWVISLMLNGNAYALKAKDERGVVIGLYILDPNRVRPYVAPGSMVLYEVSADNLAGLDQEVMVPASEIIHQKINPLYHPLVGLSPLYAAHLAAANGLEIQETSTDFFNNGAKPGGVLTAPGTISQEVADRLKLEWEKSFSGDNRGKTAVLGDGLKFETMSVNATDAQLIEQLKYSAEMVSTTFHIPPEIPGFRPLPTGQDANGLMQIYYSNCLQRLIEGLEISLGQGIGLPANYEIRFRIKQLLRMDAATTMQWLRDGIEGAILKTDEARVELGYEPTEGGDQIWRQQQYYSLSALAKRDAENPAPGSPSETDPEPAPEPEEEPEETIEESLGDLIERAITASLAQQKPINDDIDADRLTDLAMENI